jgi:hypothetical protein
LQNRGRQSVGKTAGRLGKNYEGSFDPSGPEMSDFGGKADISDRLADVR